MDSRVPSVAFVFDGYASEHRSGKKGRRRRMAGILRFPRRGQLQALLSRDEEDSMKCEFPECERTMLETVEQDGGAYCDTHALWVVAGCHLVTNRAGSDTDVTVQKLLARAGGRSRRN